MLKPTKKAVPFASAYVFLVLFFLMVAHLALSNIAAYAPWLLACGVFYWSALHPRLISSISVVVLGLLVDGLLGVPFGVHALALLVLRFSSAKQHQTLKDQPVSVLFVGFVVNFALCLALILLVQLMLSVPFDAAVLGWYASTILLAPLIFVCMQWLEGQILRSVVS